MNQRKEKPQLKNQKISDLPLIKKSSAQNTTYLSSMVSGPVKMVDGGLHDDSEELEKNKGHDRKTTRKSSK
jgi:hypothetical protein